MKQHEVVTMKLSELAPAPYNPRRISEEAMGGLKASLKRFGMPQFIVFNRTTGRVVAGHQRVEALRALGETDAQVVVVTLPEEEEKALNITLNNPHIAGEFTPALGDLLPPLRELLGDDFDALRLDPLADLFPPGGNGGTGEGPGEGGDVSLQDRFLVPPFSVLDARQGYWQDRKAAWMKVGLQGLAGRPVGLIYGSDSGRDPEFYTQKREVEARLGHVITTEEFLRDHYQNRQEGGGLSETGTSVFDPVLCELLYRWFVPGAGAILDPFAGGSVRGVVAGRLGRRYVGVDLSDKQVVSNGESWLQCAPPGPLHAWKDRPHVPPFDATPIERLDIPEGSILLKRDDYCHVGGVWGGKVRTCAALAEGAPGLVTAGSRSSPQVNIVAHIAAALKIPCRVHIPAASTPLPAELQLAETVGAEIVQHQAGRNSVIISRARKDAADRNWKEIPFGMECQEAVDQTARQVATLLPFEKEIKRIVVAVGSGMSAAGIMRGLQNHGLDIPVIGIRVGADPSDRLTEYAPASKMGRLTLITSGTDYHDPAPKDQCFWNGLALDPYYEAKCVPHLKPGDLFWIVGIRQSAVINPATSFSPAWVAGDIRDPAAGGFVEARGPYDFLFSCPPYGDLERYSDDPRDLSTMPWKKFREEYRAIIAESCAYLSKNRFAAFVVGDYRDKKSGVYRNFVSETIQAFLDAGLRLYNEAILVTMLGSLPVLVARQFTAGRKLGKTHQNVLIFVKGDPVLATEACGLIEIAEEIAPKEGAPDEANHPV